METAYINLTPMCSTHRDVVAKAVCLKNKELFCFPCALDKAKSDTYTIQEIDRVSEGKEKLLLEYLLMKQVASRKENEISELERKTDEVKGNLEEQVNAIYEKLSEKLSKLKENTVSSIEMKRVLFLKKFQSDKNELEKVQKVINENIENLSSATACDLERSKSDLNENKKKLNDGFADYELNVEGVFSSKKIFQEILSRSGDVLGDVAINNSEHYAKVTSDETYSSSESYKKLTNQHTEPGSPPPKIPPKPFIVSSDESSDKPVVVPRKRESVSEETSQATPSDKSISKQNDAKTAADESKQEKSRKSKLGLFGKRRKEKLEEYEDVQLLSQKRTHAKYLINTSLTLSGLESLFDSPCKFSKLVALSPGRIGLLTMKHSSVVVADLDGRIHCSKAHLDGLISIVAMEENQLAVLNTKDGTKIQIIDVSKTDFETKNTIEIKLEVSDVTGFDYSRSKSRFAICTRTKHLVTDGKGKKIKLTDIGNVIGRLDLVTTYDFNNDCIFVLNNENKSLKCVSLKKLESIWKRKCEDQLFHPKAVCLYQDKLCVASVGTVAIFAAKDGEPVRKHETFDLIKDCLGICVVDDVLVLSSNSDTIEESRKLAFIGI